MMVIKESNYIVILNRVCGGNIVITIEKNATNTINNNMPHCTIRYSGF